MRDCPGRLCAAAPLEAWDRWIKEEEDIADDITVVCGALRWPRKRRLLLQLSLLLPLLVIVCLLLLI